MYLHVQGKEGMLLVPEDCTGSARLMAGYYLYIAKISTIRPKRKGLKTAIIIP